MKMINKGFCSYDDIWNGMTFEECINKRNKG